MNSGSLNYLWAQVHVWVMSVLQQHLSLAWLQKGNKRFLMVVFLHPVISPAAHWHSRDLLPPDHIQSGPAPQSRQQRHSYLGDRLISCIPRTHYPPQSVGQFVSFVPCFFFLCARHSGLPSSDWQPLLQRRRHHPDRHFWLHLLRHSRPDTVGCGNTGAGSGGAAGSHKSTGGSWEHCHRNSGTNDRWFW